MSFCANFVTVQNAWQMDLGCVDDNGDKRTCTGEEIAGIVQRG